MITKEYLQQELAKRIDGYKRGVATTTTTDNIIAEMKSILVLVDALNDYEKKYNEALARAKDVKNGPSPHDSSVATVEYIFPELRESEDERIRKEIIAFLKHYHTGEGDSVTYDNDWLVYLEKQKEQKPAEWSEEDNNMWTHLNGYLNGFSCSEDAIKQMADWFYELPDRFNLQPKQEWSEEDEKIMESLISLIETIGEYYISLETIDRYVAWLKSLRPSWKPSEEQMEELWNVISYIEKPDSNFLGVPALLESLYEQLKKL